MLIVIEGLDGSGKSTQVRKLKEYIVRSGRALEYIHFPRFDTPLYGDLLARFLRGELGSIDRVHPRLVALLFAEDRNAAAPAIREALAAGRTVLLDRYVYSNIAFQCAKLEDKAERDELRDWIFDTEYRHFGIPVPDVNIFLDVPVDFVKGHAAHLLQLLCPGGLQQAGDLGVHGVGQCNLHTVRPFRRRMPRSDSSIAHPPH